MEGVGEARFGGTFTLTIDDKGRLTIPSSFRKLLGEEIVLRKNREDHSVEILSPSTWDLLLERMIEILSGEPSVTPADVKLLRTLEAANVVYTAIDKQGRALVPAEMKASAGIAGTQAVVTGAYDRVKVWAPEVWAAKQAEGDKEEFIARVYSKLNF